MAFEVTFELKESDLAYFRDVMRASKSEAKNLAEAEILANAKSLSKDIPVDVPLFISERIKKSATLVAMIEDSEWKILAQERADVLSALAYFSDPEDLVPDYIPVLGFLDDAIMIELVVEELKDNIEAFLAFCHYRKREEGRHSDESITRDEWLEAKRKELHSRMRNRRAGRSSSRSVFELNILKILNR